MAAPRRRGPGIKAQIVSMNRKARRNYEIQDVFEAGLMLTGTEVKSLRAGQANIAESYAEIKDGEAWLVNATIPEYRYANRFNHAPGRLRKLLLRRREISKLDGTLRKSGMTLVPLCLYFNEKGKAKLEIGVGRGKKLYDKRADEKDRDWKRSRDRLLRDKG